MKTAWHQGAEGSRAGAQSLARFNRWTQKLAAKAAGAARDFSDRLENLIRDQAVSAIADFEERFKAAAESGTKRFPHLKADSDFHFAVDELGPCRLAAARTYLEAEDEGDYGRLIRFLQLSAAGLRYDVEEADSADDVSDALLRSLDGIHDFLQAHSLTTPQYIREESPLRLTYRPNLRAPDLHLRFRSSSDIQIKEFASFLARRRGVDEHRRFTKDEAKRRVTVA